MLKIALVTEELAVFGRSGGIGAAIYELALLLSSGGHEVDLFYIPTQHFEENQKQLIINSFAERGIKITFVDISKYVWNKDDVKSRSYGVYKFIYDYGKIYDFIHFHDYKGLGFYCCSAKSQNLAFQTTTLVVQLHGPSRWTVHANRGLFVHPDQLLIDFMEREAIRLADRVVSPSNYLIEWLRDNNFVLPPAERVHMIKNVYSQCAQLCAAKRAPGAPQQVRELIFFGRHEPRKGITTFCDALDFAAETLADAGIKVCFLGGLGEIHGAPSGLYLSERAKRWTFPIEIRAGFGRIDAINFLASQNDALVIIPSSAENSPYTVVEALAAGRPIVTSNAGGGKELVAAEFHDEAIVDVEPETLAERIIQLVIAGVRRPAFAESPQAVEEQWLDFHETMRCPSTTGQGSGTKPRVVVGITHFERPRKLIGAIMSVLRQTYENIELVVVDDGSRSESTVQALTKIEILLNRVGGRFIRRENGYLGAARNTIAKETDSDYILFLDDDDILLPHAVERLVSIANHTAANIINCLNIYLDVNERSEHELNPENFIGKVSYLPLGGPIAIAHLSNQFGAATALIERNFFDKLGGYTEIKHVGYEDYEFYVRAIQAGCDLRIAPEPLYLYEVGKPSMISATSRIVNKQRVVAAIDVAGNPAQWLDAINLAAGSESLEDEKNMVSWRNQISPHREYIERVMITQGDLPAQMAALADYALAIGAPNVAEAWRNSLVTPSVGGGGHHERVNKRTRPVRNYNTPEVIEPTAAIGMHADLIALLKLDRTDDMLLEMLRELDTSGEANDIMIDWAFFLAAMTNLKPNSAEQLADRLSDVFVDLSLAARLQGAVAVLDIVAGRKAEAKAAITTLAAKEANEYIEHYSDLRAGYKERAQEEALNHFHNHGFRERRLGFPVLQRVAQTAGRRLGKDIRPWHLCNHFDELFGQCTCSLTVRS